MARETLFETQEIIGLAYIEGLGYAAQVSPAPFALAVGETYVIEVEGNEFTRTAYAFDAFAPGTIAVGNEYPVTGVQDGMPVIIGYQPDTDFMAFISMTEVDSMTIGVYKGVEEKPVNIILRNPMGEEEEYPMRPMIELDTTDGDTVLYSKGEVLDSITIEPDFSAGDMTVTAPDGYLVQSAVIAKPENLKPENIAKDEVVAGVVGTHEGGGGGLQPYVFTIVKYTYSHNLSSTGNISKTITVTLPPDAVIINAMYFTRLYKSGTSSTVSSGDNKYIAPLAPTITKTEENITVKCTYAFTSSYKATCYTLHLCISYYVPGFYVSEDGVMYADETATVLPSCAYMAGVTKADLSKGTFTNVPEYAFYGSDFAGITEILLPSTVAEIGAYAFGDSPIVIDFSRHTTVPTLSNANAFNVDTGLQIRVPAALYDEWIATTNWSTIASKIVAV